MSPYVARLPALFLVSVLLNTSNAAFFPAAPPTLVQLWQGADLVIYAEVTKKSEIAWGDVTQLTVLATLKSKGPKVDGKLQVITRVGGCPYPYRFCEDTKVLAFLAYDAEDKQWTQYGLLASCRELDAKSYERYAQSLSELDAILAEDDPAQRTRRMAQWYVDLAAHPVTRWDGYQGIHRMIFRHKGDRSAVLTKKHEQRLLKAIVSEKPPGRSSVGVVDLLAEYPSDDLDLYLMESLRHCDKPGWSRLTETTMEILPNRLKMTLSVDLLVDLDTYYKRRTHVYYDIDREEEAELFELERGELKRIWPTLAARVLRECEAARKRREY